MFVRLDVSSIQKYVQKPLYIENTQDSSFLVIDKLDLFYPTSHLSLPHFKKANFHICFQMFMWADVSEFVCKHFPDILLISRFLQLTSASEACFLHSDCVTNATGFQRCRDREVYQVSGIQGKSDNESQDNSYRMEFINRVRAHETIWLSVLS